MPEGSCVDVNELKQEFSTFGYNLENEEIIDKVLFICNLHKLSAEDVFARWTAFTSKLKLINKNPTSSLLDQMEQQMSHEKSMKSTPKAIKKAIKTDSYVEDSLDDADDLLDAYTPMGTKLPTFISRTPDISGTPRSSTNDKKRQHTPDTSASKRSTSMYKSPGTVFSPETQSSVSTTPSQLFGTRTNAGVVTAQFGISNPASWTNTAENLVTVEHYDLTSTLKEPYLYQREKLLDKAEYQNDIIEQLGQHMLKLNTNQVFSNVSTPQQEEVTVLGRICSDSNGRLNPSSVLLEGTLDTSRGHCVQLDLVQLKQFSIFPGQVVTATGVNSDGSRFIAKDLSTGSPLPLSSNPLTLTELKGPLQIVVAAGPFHTTDSLEHEPLAELMAYVSTNKPHVLILIGPFVDCKNDQILQTLKKTYTETFYDCLNSILQNIDGEDIQLVIVPSLRDTHHHFVYPVPPFTAPVLLTNADKLRWKNVHLMPEPCTLTIEGVVIGISSTDVLFHLGKEEISHLPGPSDRMARLCRHLLIQHSYYPLCPPSEEVNVDYENCEMFARLPVTPHILVLPSDLRNFIKDVDGCLVVNPERLTKGKAGGTYSRIQIRPDHVQPASSITSLVTAEVLRI